MFSPREGRGKDSGVQQLGVLTSQPCYLFATCVALPLCLDCLPRRECVEFYRGTFEEVFVKNIYVGNMSFHTDEESLRTAFSQFGAVDQVNIVRDRDSGQPRGFAFVEMPNDSEADAAMSQLNGSTLDGRQLTVNEARPKTER